MRERPFARQRRLDPRALVVAQRAVEDEDFAQRAREPVGDAVAPVLVARHPIPVDAPAPDGRREVHRRRALRQHDRDHVRTRRAVDVEVEGRRRVDAALRRPPALAVQVLVRVAPVPLRALPPVEGPGRRHVPGAQADAGLLAVHRRVDERVAVGREARVGRVARLRHRHEDERAVADQPRGGEERERVRRLRRVREAEAHARQLAADALLAVERQVRRIDGRGRRAREHEPVARRRAPGADAARPVDVQRVGARGVEVDDAAIHRLNRHVCDGAQPSLQDHGVPGIRLPAAHAERPRTDLHEADVPRHLRQQARLPVA